jgi:hypothetical protein
MTSLAAGERTIVRSQRLQFIFSTERGRAALDRLPNRIQQHLLINRLGKKFHSSGFHRLDGSLYVASAGEKDNRHATALRGDSLLKFETIHIREECLEDQTARNGGASAGEELVCR